MTKPWLVKVGVLFIKKKGCIVLTHPHYQYRKYNPKYVLFENGKVVSIND